MINEPEHRELITLSRSVLDQIMEHPPTEIVPTTLSHSTVPNRSERGRPAPRAMEFVEEGTDEIDVEVAEEVPSPSAAVSVSEPIQARRPSKEPIQARRPSKERLQSQSVQP